MNLAECDNAGFFGRIYNGGTVRNLTIAADIQIANEYVTTSNVVGGFAGNVDSAIFENCHFSGNVLIHTGYIGGFVGTSTGGTYRLCSNTGDLTNLNVNGVVGGIIGIDNGSNLTGCYNTGNLKLDAASGICGGLVGDAHWGATVNACWVTGNLTASVKGGIFGRGNGYNIENSYCSMSIGHMGGDGSWSTNNVGYFEGPVPTADQIRYMNQLIYSLGWKYNEEGILVPLDGNNIPSNPIKPW